MQAIILNNRDQILNTPRQQDSIKTKHNEIIAISNKAFSLKNNNLISKSLKIPMKKYFFRH